MKMSIYELTLAIIKPHIIKNPVSLDGIRNIILNAGFKIVRSKRKQIQKQEAEYFYEEHKERFFYNRLVAFMTSGPSELYILAKENAIHDWRRVMGPTKTYKAVFSNPLSIRGQYGLSDTRNATHGSDSPQSAKREIEIFFPEFDYEKWFREEEIHFRNNNIVFVKPDFVHLPKKLR